jgi:hypothetical protein
MKHLIFVRAEPPGRFTAQVWGLPEVRAEADTDFDAIREVRERLQEWLKSASIVEINLPDLRPLNPVVAWFGYAKDDADHQLYLEEIRKYREEVDRRAQEEQERRECSDSSSTPTT